MIAAAFVLGGAFLFRLRGGGFVALGTTLGARAVWAGGMTLAALLLVRDPWLGWLLPALWLGTLMGHAEWMDLGRMGGSRSDDFWHLALRGVLWTAPAGCVLFGLGYPPPAAIGLGLSGMAQPFIYELAWRVPSRVPHLERGAELGEALFGAWLGGALWLALTWS